MTLTILVVSLSALFEQDMQNYTINIHFSSLSTEQRVSLFFDSILRHSTTHLSALYSTPRLFKNFMQRECTPSLTMPRLPISVLKAKAAALATPAASARRTTHATRLRSASDSSLSTNSQSIRLEIEADPEPEPEPEPLELVYNIRERTLRKVLRSSVLKQDVGSSPLVELPFQGPPLLVDGRMQIVPIPKWNMEVGFFWRTCNGERTEVMWRRVHLPWKIWVQRNFGRKEMWRDLWIERS